MIAYILNNIVSSDEYKHFFLAEKWYINLVEEVIRDVVPVISDSLAFITLGEKLEYNI